MSGEVPSGGSGYRILKVAHQRRNSGLGARSTSQVQQSALRWSIRTFGVASMAFLNSLHAKGTDRDRFSGEI